MSALGADVRPGSGIPVVLLHGFAGNRLVWKPVIDRLPPELFLIAYDLPGHAGSLDYPEAGPPKVAAKAVLADLAARGIPHAHLVGHSMGGAIATLAAMTEPGRVASLTLLAPGGYGPEIDAALLRRLASVADAGELRECFRHMSRRPVEIAQAEWDAAYRLRTVEGQAEMLQKIAALITRDDRQGMIPAELVAGIEAPTRVLWGEDDGVVPFAQTANLPARFDLVRLPATGHMLIEEAPEEVAAAILTQAAREGAHS